MSQSVSSKPKDSKSDLSPMSALHTAISIREDENKANKADFLRLTRVIRDTFRTNPNDPTANHKMGVIYLQCASIWKEGASAFHMKAIEHLSKAIKFQNTVTPNRQMLFQDYYHLGLCQLALNKAPIACSSLMQARDIITKGSDFATAEEIALQTQNIDAILLKNSKQTKP